MLMVAIKDDGAPPPVELRPITPPAPDPVSQLPLRWYAVQTTPNRERLVESQLRLLGYAVFYPHNLIYRRARLVHGHRVPEGHVIKPYFTGYLFVGVRIGQPLVGVNTLMGVLGVLGSRPAMVPERSPGDIDTKVGQLPKAFMSSMLAAAVPGLCKTCKGRHKREDLVMSSCGLIGEIDDRPPVHAYLPGQTVVFAKTSPFWPHMARVVHLDRHGEVEVEADLFGRPTPFKVHHTQLGEVVEATQAAELDSQKR